MPRQGLHTLPAVRLPHEELPALFAHEVRNEMTTSKSAEKYAFLRRKKT